MLIFGTVDQWVFYRFYSLWIFYRHSKKVYEQNTRDKILSEEKQSVAMVTVNPRVATVAAKAPKQG